MYSEFVLNMFAEIRRKDRILDEDAMYRLLEENEYGFLSMIGINEFGYGIPISYAKDGDRIYFHCAPEGFKLECLRKNPAVSFCVVGKTQLIPDKFTTAYESVLVFGKIQMELSDEECIHALRLLVKKYASGFEMPGEKYIEKSFYRTAILRLDIEHMSGKCKRL